MTFSPRYEAKQYAEPLGWCVDLNCPSIGRTVATGLDERDAVSIAAALNREECCAPDDCGGYCIAANPTTTEGN